MKCKSISLLYYGWIICKLDSWGISIFPNMHCNPDLCSSKYISGTHILYRCIYKYCQGKQAHCVRSIYARGYCMRPPRPKHSGAHFGTSSVYLSFFFFLRMNINRHSTWDLVHNSYIFKKKSEKNLWPPSLSQRRPSSLYARDPEAEYSLRPPPSIV